MPLSPSRASLAATLILGAGPGWADLIDSDTTIRDALCVGNGCLSTENFGNDPLRLKATTLSIHFDDTSASGGSFPANDWRVYANEPGQNDRDIFKITDMTGGADLLLLEAGAPQNAIYLARSGRLGLGVSAPQADLHLLKPDTPTLRLEQSTAGGFSAYTWEIGGSDGSFFVRDAVTGDIPFSVVAGANDGIATFRGGRMGVGVEYPDTALHVVSTEGTGNLKMEDTGGSGPLRMLDLRNDGAVQIYMNNTSRSDASWLFSAGQSMWLSPTENPHDRVFELSNTGDILIDGVVVESSDRTRKTAMEPVDSAKILAGVAALDIAEWTYLHDAEAGTRHIGPMAQDFHANFGLGASETGIASLDGNGVALAAIQALLARIEALETQLSAR
ncbi:tail fiber domain-containing protein [Jannaschia seohaensis]|uniref:Chaperone of endosialidase n=1 Tax=Jannaschia seohaensis TaxID=475081 RepID=A0A2Y9C8L0_9RHOB|nr:tail fiber domain-containing protein [Jannaschia seohaensis]PWJ15784.1 endosialidase-like protein [Jannaschia seohaensis]SSA49463.1 Chaperone of endosialidase [Jannaschia seohaensis]